MRLLIAAGLMASLLFVRAGRADDEKPATPERRVSVDLRDVPLRKALEEAVAGQKLEVAVEKAVGELPVTLALRDIDVETALRLIVRVAAKRDRRVVLVREGEGFAVRLQEETVIPNSDLEFLFPPRRPGDPEYVIAQLPAPSREAIDRLAQYMHLVPLRLAPEGPSSYRFGGSSYSQLPMRLSGGARPPQLPMYHLLQPGIAVNQPGVPTQQGSPLGLPNERPSGPGAGDPGKGTGGGTIGSPPSSP